MAGGGERDAERGEHDAVDEKRTDAHEEPGIARDRLGRPRMEALGEFAQEGGLVDRWAQALDRHRGDHRLRCGCGRWRGNEHGRGRFDLSGRLDRRRRCRRRRHARRREHVRVAAQHRAQERRRRQRQVVGVAQGLAGTDAVGRLGERRPALHTAVRSGGIREGARGAGQRIDHRARMLCRAPRANKARPVCTRPAGPCVQRPRGRCVKARARAPNAISRRGRRSVPARVPPPRSTRSRCGGCAVRAHTRRRPR